MDNDSVIRGLLNSGGGLVTRRDLRTAGMQRTVTRRISAGQLRPVLPSVLTSHDVVLDEHSRLRAALLQAGPDAVLTHVSALRNWGLWDGPAPVVHVAVPRGKSKVIGWLHIHVHRSREAVLHNGLPTQSPADALAAAAVDLTMDELRFPAAEAARLGMLCAEQLTQGRRPNVMGKLRPLAEEIAAGAESGGEAKYWRLLHDSHLPTPELQRWLQTHDGRKRVDGYWDMFLMAVEIDGRIHHTKVRAFGRDTRRQNAIHATGVLIIRFDVATVMSEPGYVLSETEANMQARRSLLEGRRPVV